MIGHVAPEAALGGPIARLHEGDVVTIDVATRRLDADADLGRSHRRPGTAAEAARRAGQVRQHRDLGGRRGRDRADEGSAMSTSINVSPITDAEPQKRTGAEMIWEVLEQEGIEVVFGYPGGAIMPAYDALPKYKVRHVLVRHEQGAAHMADGYARASGRVGVAIATSGPGATNLVTGIATAMLDSIPCVFITGQVSSHLIGTDGFQETDVTGVTLPITKHNWLVTKAKDVGPVLREAFHVARSGRPGPVLVDITKDAQQASCDFDPADRALARAPRRGAAALGLAAVHEAYERAARLIDVAERPLILAGHGIVQAGATAELLAFVERTGVPVASTLLGLGGFPATHPKALGMMGMHGEAWVNRAVQEADLLIALGSPAGAVQAHDHAGGADRQPALVDAGRRSGAASRTRPCG